VCVGRSDLLYEEEPAAKRYFRRVSYSQPFLRLSPLRVPREPDALGEIGAAMERLRESPASTTSDRTKYQDDGCRAGRHPTPDTDDIVRSRDPPHRAATGAARMTERGSGSPQSKMPA
jgi:hypothetical protein